MDNSFDSRIPAALLSWYDRHARDLPWRRTHDPYAILVSEFMLQQTQVKTVLPYYVAFLDRFPDALSLARSHLEEVLEAWKGLGYYRRARNLHAAAQAVVDRFGGSVPDAPNDLLSLPGVGEYAAAAVLSIAFGKPHPVVDGNVVRVGARILELHDPADSIRMRRRIGRGLEAVIPIDRPGDFNQAMMELGATLCKVQRPECDRCPIAAYCRAKAAGRVEELPVPAKRAKVREERYSVVVLRHGSSTLLVRRPDEGLLAGLWEFPRLPPDLVAREGPGLVSALAGLGAAGGGQDSGIEALLAGTDAIDVRRAGSVTHRFSHLTWHLDVLRAEIGSSHATEVAERPEIGARWVPDDRVDQMALPKAMQNVWELVRTDEGRGPVRAPRETESRRE